MVSPVDLFIDRKRTLKAFLCRREVTKGLQDAAEVVGDGGYLWMVSAIRIFSKNQSPFIMSLSLDKLSTSPQIRARLIQDMICFFMSHLPRLGVDSRCHSVR